MSRRHIWFAVVTCLSLAACNTPAHRQRADDAAAANDAATQTMACQQNLALQPAYVVIASKLPIAQLEPTPAQLADDSRPTPEEAAVLSRLLDALAPCRSLNLGHLATISSQTAATVQQRYNANNSVVLRLIAGEVTYGDANRELLKIREASIRQLALINDRIKRQLDAIDN